MNESIGYKHHPTRRVRCGVTAIDCNLPANLSERGNKPPDSFPPGLTEDERTEGPRAPFGHSRRKKQKKLFPNYVSQKVGWADNAATARSFGFSDKRGGTKIIQYAKVAQHAAWDK